MVNRWPPLDSARQIGIGCDFHERSDGSGDGASRGEIFDRNFWQIEFGSVGGF